MLNPNIIVSENCWVIDESGKRYVDFEAGVWCASLGHNNRQINEAMIRQMGIISHVGYRYTTKVVNEAAEKVLGLLGFADGRCVFLSSGSEAVEFAVQLSKKAMGRPYLLCLEGYFLSSYGTSAVRGKNEWISLDISQYNGNPEDFLRDVPFGDIGAFVFEPGNASGMVKLPPKDLIAAIEAKIRKNGGIIAVNEITAGTGRTGKWFGHQHYSIRPDVVAIGKGIGNGYPVSVVALSSQMADMAGKAGFRYAQSHQDDPLGCAVVSEVITIIENNGMIQRSADMGLVLKAQLEALKAKHSFIKEVRGIGLMFVMEFHHDKKLPLEKIHREVFDKGYIVGVSPLANLLRFYPPLTIDGAQIKAMAAALDAVLRGYA